VPLDQMPLEYIDEDIDLTDAGEVIDLFEDVARMNETAQGRTGSLIELGSAGQLLMTGELYDHRLNFKRILKLAALDQSTDNHLLLHNVIHPVPAPNGLDASILTLAYIAALQMKYQNQVHMLLANHELGQVIGETIHRGKFYVSVQFDEGIDQLFDEDGEDVRDAMKKYIWSLPLAVRTKSGMFACNSLPGPEQFESFDPNVLHRMLLDDERAIGGHAHNMVWGNNHGANVILTLRRQWGVKTFVTGGGPTKEGYAIPHDTLLKLSSWNKVGVVVPINLWKNYTAQTMAEDAVLLSSIEV
jgi:hypothetical protein